MRLSAAEASLRETFPDAYIYGVELEMVDELGMYPSEEIAKVYLGVLPVFDTLGKVWLVPPDYESHILFPDSMSEKEIDSKLGDWDGWDDPPSDFVPRHLRIDPISARVAIEKVFPYASFFLGEDSLLYLDLGSSIVDGPNGSSELRLTVERGSAEWRELVELAEDPESLLRDDDDYDEDGQLAFFNDFDPVRIQDLGWEMIEDPTLRDTRWLFEQLDEREATDQGIYDAGVLLERMRPFVDSQPLSRLLAAGEHHQLEFKESAHTSAHDGSMNRKIRWNIVKAAAGFLNAHGGSLLIGVRDDRSLRGIDDDLQFVNGANEDGYVLWVTDVLAEALGDSKAARCRVAIERITDVRLCRVTIERSQEPVFARIESRKGLFFVRVNASTREFSAEEAQKYISIHFSDRSGE